MSMPIIKGLEIERNELSRRVRRLGQVLKLDDIDQDLSAEIRALLEIQLAAMTTYLAVLDRRMNLEAAPSE